MKNIGIKIIEHIFEEVNDFTRAEMCRQFMSLDKAREYRIRLLRSYIARYKPNMDDELEEGDVFCYVSGGRVHIGTAVVIDDTIITSGDIVTRDEILCRIDPLQDDWEWDAEDFEDEDVVVDSDTVIGGSDE